MRIYRWNVKPELVRFVAVALLTYLVEVARRYTAGEFDHVLAWGPVIIGLVVGGVQFVGARLLAMLGDSGPDLRPPGQRRVEITSDTEPRV